MDFIEKEKLKLDKGQFELKRRRLNWSQVAKPKTLDFCRSFAEQANFAMKVLKIEMPKLFSSESELILQV